MIVDIGGGTTEVAVISLGGMVVSKSLEIAGDEMDESIVQYFRKKYNLLIGDNSAEDVKVKIGSVFPLSEETRMEVRGRDQVSGLPKTVVVSSEEIRQAMLEPTKSIIEVIKDTLEETPAELSADLVERGIWLAGGGSQIRGFADLLSQETELPVHIAEEALTCVVRGTGRYLEELEKFIGSKRSLI
jgi:rod shape-determining protein MreB